jgi:hypothetical protein
MKVTVGKWNSATNGPGNKSDVSTNENKRNCKTKLQSKIPTGQENNE